MSLVDLLTDLHRRGVRLTVRDGRLRVSAPLGAISNETRAALQTHRDTLMTLLVTWRDVLASWSPDERAEWSERAAIMQYDGGLSRHAAEAHAFVDVFCARGGAS